VTAIPHNGIFGVINLEAQGAVTMRVLGIVLIAGGGIGLALALAMDVSVKAGGQRVGSGEYSTYIPEMRVNNLGLMEDRRNYIIISCVSILVGALFIGFGALADTQSSSEKEAPPPSEDDLKQKRTGRLREEEVQRRRDQVLEGRNAT